MKYLRLTTDIARMCIAVPFYLMALVAGGVAALLEYAADKLDVPDSGGWQ
jgi:hypothetical protein